MLDDPLQMDTRSGSQQNHLILCLSGPLVLRNVFAFQNKVREDRSHYLIIDLTDVPYIDSAGIGALVGTYVSHQRDGCAVALAGVNDRVRNALEITQVHQIFKIFSNLEEAEAAACALAAKRPA
jgi:anti-sigma B factor antagonist